MGKVIAKIMDIDGEYREMPDFPIAVVREKSKDNDLYTDIVDPIFNDKIWNNLYGRIMTLVEATTEAHKLKAVKDLFSRELRDWCNDVYGSARDITVLNKEHEQHLVNNIYLR